ncbi:PucR family transcriptional regulator [Longispora albida]|uniref:PucR family transcriptional regulator n=1 Tax=Longispora albida TaxID=203523 RepID=UPI000363373B|nr:PucR family transcriptional regulator ligand-binding domain-containing protein [Longispora albida]
MFPTVRDVLALDPVRHGAPRVVAGAAGLDRPVRWVHSAEVPDIAGLLRGGELVLTTGIGMPASDAGLRTFIAELAEVGCSGLVVELGRRYTLAVPKSMVIAAERAGLPLVELHRATPFVPITEAVHALILDAQLAELTATEEIHQRFTELTVEGADPADVVREVAQLAHAPVVLENLARQVLAYDPASDRAELLLAGWEAFSRSLRGEGRTSYDPATGWLSTTVGARGHDWGRLLMRYAGDAPPPSRLIILLERAASTLALDRLVRRDEEGLEHQVHRTLLTGLLEHSRSAAEIALRARALGVPLERRRLVGLVLRRREDDPAGAAKQGGRSPVAAQLQLRELTDGVGAALRETRLPGLCGALDEHSVGVLLALPAADREPAALAAFAEAVHKGSSQALVIGAGSGVDEIREARRSLLEAGQVAQVARHATRQAPYYQLTDVGLRGLLHLLRGDARLQTYVERELGPLLTSRSGAQGEELLGALRAYLSCGRNKSAAAAALHLSRPAFYERLNRIGRLLNVDLESAEDCLSLHVAILALDALRD